jgi:hypothetical protein
MKSKLPGVSGTDTVLLDKCDKAMLMRIGQLIYAAAQNSSEFESLRKNTADRLVKEAGVPATSIGDTQFYVFRDEPKLLHIPIPEVRNRNEMTDDEFETYLVELGVVTIRACKHA